MHLFEYEMSPSTAAGGRQKMGRPEGTPNLHDGRLLKADESFFSIFLPYLIQ